jgi:hypothetical protein
LTVAVAGAVIPVVVAAAGRMTHHWQPADDEAAALAHFDELLDSAEDALLSVFVVPPPT